MNASDVIQFLQANPEFFDDNSTLLTDLTVTHPHNGQAISLTERQLIELVKRKVQGNLTVPASLVDPVTVLIVQQLKLESGQV